jgi:hypothetical protein
LSQCGRLTYFGTTLPILFSQWIVEIWSSAMRSFPGIAAMTAVEQMTRIGRAPLRWLSTLAITFTLALGVPTLASAQAYPNGANIIGLVTQTASFDGGAFSFTVTSTQSNGTTSTQMFFIVDSSTASIPIRVANILAAAAEGSTVNVWTYGVSYSFGGQGGYLSEIEFVSH